MRWIILLFILSSCSKSQLNTNDQSVVLSDSNLYLDSDSDIRIFYVTSDSDPGLFVTQLVTDVGVPALDVPESVFNSDYGDRSNPDNPQYLDLIARVYTRTPKKNGDFYFEVPVLGNLLEVSNVTTALSWILRWSFPNYQVRISQNSFRNLVRSIELICSTCREKTNSQLVEFILENDPLKLKLFKVLELQNPDIDINSFNYSPPGVLFVRSIPNLGLNGFTNLDVKELAKISISLYLVNPIRSNEPLNPSSWDRTFNSAITSTYNPNFEYIFTYDDKGTHDITPAFVGLSGVPTLKFTYTVADVNRSPYCDVPMVVNVKSNRNNEIDLSSLCRDPDIEDTFVNYSLISGPSGLTISAGGILRWSPLQPADNHAYTTKVTFLVNDSKLGYQTVEATINVGPDGLPVFTLIPTSFDFSEGQSAIYTFSAVDPDGDLMVMRVRQVDVVSTGLPNGSGILTNVIRSGTNGMFSYDWDFKPSWMQTIGVNSTVRLKAALYYDPADPRLNSAVELSSQIITLNIENTDDPPTWIVQPGDMAATENVDMAMAFLGTATDPTPNPTSVTYSMETNSLAACNWAQLSGYVVTDSGSAYFNMAPPFSSQPECTFEIIATDANGLTSKSAPFLLTMTDVNRPIIEIAGGPTLFVTPEMKYLPLDLTTIFSDPDYEEQDPLERNFKYNCLWDSDLDGNYETPCAGAGATSNINITFYREILDGRWMPSATSAGNYNIRLTVTDKGNTSATHDFTIQVDQAPAPMNLDISQDGISANDELVGTENTDLSFYLRARAATTDAIDIYNFKILNPTCSVIGGGTCDLDFIALPVTKTGTGDTNILYTIKPDYDDGDAELPTGKKVYNILFSLQKVGEASLYTQAAVRVTINNSNRTPSSIGVSNGSFGCPGSSANTNTDKFTICIDASKDAKSGINWQKYYTVNFTPNDLDTTNDAYSFAWLEDYVPNTLTNYQWKFKLPSCVNPGTNTVTRLFHLNLSDGRGGNLQRSIELKIFKANTAGMCMQ